ncbi:DNA polymerase I [Alistipes sp. Z76]|nr:DNA polymerase I [Alistipes sp. Z76]NCE70046.1 DNA polymerase I [Muribaculaceae bacterium M3]
MKRLFLIDAYALVFKYYYAFMGRPMRNRFGMNTSILFGFTKFLRDIMKRESPDMLGVALDPKGGSFRSERFADYKANRPATPEDIIASVPYLCRLLEAMRIPVFEVEGYEADDVIGTLAYRASEAGYDVYMVTPDKDYGQLVGPRRHIYKQKGDGIEIVDAAAVCAKYGIDDPVLVRDILALWGDASDNIPGVPGIGEKGACKLVAEWGAVENILANVGKIKGKQGEKIAAWGDRLLLAKDLTTIRTDVPVEFSPDDLTICPPNIDELKALYAELDFTSFLRDVYNMAPAEESDAPRQDPQRQLAEMARAKSEAAKRNALAGQGDLFAAPAETPQSVEAPAAESLRTPLETADDSPLLATAATTPHDYRLVTEAEELAQLVGELSAEKEICFDTETTGFDIFNDRIVGLSLAVRPHEAWYVSFTPENRDTFAALLRPLFENDRITKVAQNMKFDIMVLSRLGIEVRGRKIDTMIVHYLLDPEARHNMNYLAERYLDYSPIRIETLIGRGTRQLTMDQVNLHSVKEYAAEDADITLQLKHVLWRELEEAGLTELYSRVEEPMIDVLARMETAGVKVDCSLLDEYAVELNARLAELEREVRAEAGEPTLNINSARQLGEVLFAKMRIAEKPKMTKTRQFSTDEEYLQGFAGKHRIVDLILQYRGVKKLLSTYVEALPQLVNRATGRIHTSFNQAVTATGRLSSTNPNLQNIPVRDDMGRRIREAFVPSDDDHLLLSADYSQVELRLMAHLSGDESLIAAFLHDEDVHAATAAKLFHKRIDEVTPDERRKAKTANFGIIYGISAFGLSQRLDIPRKEAKELIDGYFASYPKVKEYMDGAIAAARETGCVTTVFGRRRILRDIDSRNAVARGVAERNAINAPIQGSAADIMKLAMIEIDRRFREEGIRSRMILQVHDEVIVDMLRSESDRVTAIVREAMEGAASLRVPLISDAGEGENWLQAH